MTPHKLLENTLNSMDNQQTKPLKCGRKPNTYEQQKMHLSIYVRRIDIEKMGGRDRVRRIIYNALNEEK